MNEALKDAGLIIKFVKATLRVVRPYDYLSDFFFFFFFFFFLSLSNCIVSFSLPICVVLKMKVWFHSGGLSISFVSYIVFASVRFIMCMSINIKKCKIFGEECFV